MTHVRTSNFDQFFQETKASQDDLMILKALTRKKLFSRRFILKHPSSYNNTFNDARKSLYIQPMINHLLHTLLPTTKVYDYQVNPS